MNETEKTHWKKNIDGRYISGEDIHDEIKGLEDNMGVYIAGFGDGETFSASKNAKETKTILRFKKISNNEMLKKGVVLNKTSAMIFKIVGKSQYVDDWVGKPVTIYAEADSRHGWVVRFKPYKVPQVLKDQIKLIKATKTKEDLSKYYDGLNDKQKANIIIVNALQEQKLKIGKDEK